MPNPQDPWPTPGDVAAALEVLGASVDEVGPGWARVRLTPSSTHGNLAGTVHGGVTYALADAAATVAASREGPVRTVEVTCHYHLPVVPDDPVVATAREVSDGRVVTCVVEVDQRDERCATALVLLRRTGGRPTGGA